MILKTENGDILALSVGCLRQIERLSTENWGFKAKLAYWAIIYQKL